jgi:hypothetical protein
MPCSRGLQSVEQQGQIDGLALSAHRLRVALECRHVIVEHEVRLVQQAADQRALAVVDRTAGDEPQQALVLL